MDDDDGIQRKLVSDDDRKVLVIVFYVIVTEIISFFGIFANFTNIVIFLKQGLRDTVNVSLLGLAVSDLASSVTLTWMSLCMNPLFRYSDIPFDSVQVHYITGAWPNGCFSKISAWITTYVTVERCICIVFPLRVKSIITVKRTTILILSIFLIMIVANLPIFFSARLDYTFVAERNKTLLGLVYVDDNPMLNHSVFYISVVTKLSAMPVVISCTIILIRNLLSKSQWRKTVLGIPASAARETSAALRDKRVVKMVSLIACIFIVCFSSSCINLILTLILSPEYNHGGQFQNAFMVSWAIVISLEATKSSVNIFVYYTMSSKFKVVFNKLFRINRQRLVTVN